MFDSVWAPGGLDLEKTRLRRDVDTLVAERAAHLQQIQTLQAQLRRVTSERELLRLKRDVLEDGFLDFAEQHGLGLDELKPMMRDRLEQEAKSRGIPLD
jgi:hypothetical protein